MPDLSEEIAMAIVLTFKIMLISAKLCWNRLAMFGNLFHKSYGQPIRHQHRIFLINGISILRCIGQPVTQNICLLSSVFCFAY